MPSLQLSGLHQDTVIVAALEEKAVLAVLFLLAWLFCMLLYYSNMLGGGLRGIGGGIEDKGAIGFITALFEAEEYLAQRLVKMLLHKKDAMEMVRHDL